MKNLHIIAVAIAVVVLASLATQVEAQTISVSHKDTTYTVMMPDSTVYSYTPAQVEDLRARQIVTGTTRALADKATKDEVGRLWNRTGSGSLKAIGESAQEFQRQRFFAGVSDSSDLAARRLAWEKVAKDMEFRNIGGKAYEDWKVKGINRAYEALPRSEFEAYKAATDAKIAKLEADLKRTANNTALLVGDISGKDQARKAAYEFLANF